MTPAARKLLLATHITLSVGWIGGVLAYLVLVLAAMTTQDTQVLRSAWVSMELLGAWLLVPLALTSLVTGVAIALLTPWGLFRHYWVVTSLALTLFATVILLVHMRTVSLFAGLAGRTDADSIARMREALGGELLHAGLGLVVLVAVEALNVYKPRGVIAVPFRIRVVAISFVGLIVALLIMHLAGSEMHGTH